MPVIIVWCLPRSTQKKLRELHKSIVKAVESVEGLGIKGEDNMTVLFPQDMMSYGLGREIIVQVTDIFDRLKRTRQMRRQLAENIGTAVKKLFPKAKVECSVHPFDPESEGFWTSDSTQTDGDPATGVLAMDLEEYFTEERIAKVGFPSQLWLTRMRRLLRYSDLKTVKDVVRYGESGLQTVRCFGRMSVRVLKEILEADGIRLPWSQTR